MKIKWSLIGLAMFLAVWVSFPAGAADVDFVLQNLPKEFSGSYQWRGSTHMQDVRLTITEAYATDEGNVVAMGKGAYITDGKISAAAFSMVIIPNTLEFKMFERGSDEDSTLVTNGSYLGTISDDLSMINAAWKSNDKGKEGDLLLIAK